MEQAWWWPQQTSRTETENDKSSKQSHKILHIFETYMSKAYLHDDEKDERDEDVDLGVFPGVVVADVVKLLCHALTAPRAVVEQRDQRLVLRQLTG